MDTMLEIITVGTTNVVADIILRKHLSPDITDLTNSLHKTVSEGYMPLIKDMQDAEFMGDEMVETVLRVGCVDLAIKALKEVGAL